MVPPVATITTFGFFVLCWAQAAPAAIRTAVPMTHVTFTSFMSIFPLRPIRGSLLLVLAGIEVRQLDRVEQVLDLVLGQDLLLPDDLEDALAALVGLVRQLGRLVIAD